MRENQGDSVISIFVPVIFVASLFALAGAGWALREARAEHQRARQLLDVIENEVDVS